MSMLAFKGLEMQGMVFYSNLILAMVSIISVEVSSRKPLSTNYRQVEKKILDRILKVDIYDSQIRPLGTYSFEWVRCWWVNKGFGEPVCSQCWEDRWLHLVIWVGKSNTWQWQKGPRFGRRKHSSGMRRKQIFMRLSNLICMWGSSRMGMSFTA